MNKEVVTRESKEGKGMNKDVVTREEAIECVRKLITYLGDDPNRDGLLETPDRVIRSYEEIFAGYSIDPKKILEKTFSTQSDEMVVLSEIELYSTCEHHMLPFIGKCHIGYFPNNKVIGISKLARLMEVFSRRLQIQEELTYQIASALLKETKAKGVAVVIEAQHMCMTCRGVGKQHSIMTTSAMLGCFRDNLSYKSEFFRLLKR
ncbi:MAG: GTP cyclohydrolase I [bacterium]|jgi:GTP cyclohydrolase I